MALTVSADSGRFSNAAAVKLLLESPEWGDVGETYARSETAIDGCDVGIGFVVRTVWENVSKQTAWLLQHLNRTLFGDRGSEVSKIKCWKRCMIGRRVQSR